MCKLKIGTKRGSSWKKPFRTLQDAYKASQKGSDGEVFYVDGSRNIRVKLILIVLWSRIKHFMRKLIGYDFAICNNCTHAKYHIEHEDLPMRICTNKKSEVFNHWCTGIFVNGIEHNSACEFFEPNKFTKLLMWINQTKMKEDK